MPLIEIPPFEVVKPPPGKAAIYFLADTYYAKPNDNQFARPTNTALSLSVNNLIAAELKYDTYTVLFVEPVNLTLMASVRSVRVDQNGGRCLHYLGSWGESKLIAEFRPGSDEVYFFEHERPNEWREVDADRAGSLIDSVDSHAGPLYYSEPDAHYVGQIYDRMQCLEQCWQEKRDPYWAAAKNACMEQCAEFFDD